MFSTIIFAGFTDALPTILMIALLIGVFYMMYRSNKKQERETAEMRNNLEVGDEITTIGGIIGEIVRIKEETVTIETGKDRTKIRILRSAIRSVDVHAYEKRGDGKKPEATENKETKRGLISEKKKVKENVAPSTVTDEPSNTEPSDAEPSDAEPKE